MDISFEKRDPAAFETLTISTSAVQLDSGKYSEKTVGALVTFEDGPVRFRLDGVDPTSSVGHRADDGTSIYLNGHGEVSQFSVIAGAGSGTAMVTFYE